MKVLATTQKNVLGAVRHGVVLPKAHEKAKNVTDMVHLVLLGSIRRGRLQERVILHQRAWLID